MEKSKSVRRRTFDLQFKLTVLKDYYENNASMRGIARKYGIEKGSLSYWLKQYESEGLSLPSESKMVLEMARKKRKVLEEAAPLSEEAALREENARLKKALAYSELRNEALNEVLKIGKEKYGIDLLKKAGAK